jgi:hypothetical protein
MKQPNGTPQQLSTIKKANFLQAYTTTCSIPRAAELAAIDRGSHYNWLKVDVDYKAQFEAAKEQAIQALEDEAVRRAYLGVEKPVTVAGKREIIREYSDTLLIFLLKSARSQKYRDNVAAGSDWSRWCAARSPQGEDCDCPDPPGYRNDGEIKSLCRLAFTRYVVG